MKTDEANGRVAVGGLTVYFGLNRTLIPDLLEHLTLLAILCRNELKFKFNESAYALMSEFGLSALRLAELKKTVNSEILTNEQLDSLLDQLFPNPKKHSPNRRVIRVSPVSVRDDYIPTLLHYKLLNRSGALAYERTGAYLRRSKGVL